LDFISHFYIPCGANRGANLNIMKQLKASATLFFDNRHEKSDGTYSVKLTIYYAGEKKRYSTNIEMTLTQWQKINSDKLRDDDLKILKRKLAIQVTKAEKIIDGLEPFSFDDFEKIFFEKALAKSGCSLEQLFNNYYGELIKDGRIGNAFANRTTKNSLLLFKPSLSLFDITPDFLKSYENFMRQKNASPSTIGIYLRHLRAMINKAIEDGLLARDKYPFKKYKIPSSRNIKKALTFSELKQVLEYKSENINLQKAADFWILTYLCNGMNMTDILLLKHKSVQGDFIFFFRAKTINTKKKDLRPIKVYLTDGAKSIIAKWKSNPAKNDYLFPILEAGLTPLQIKYRTQRFLKFVNGNMKKVGMALGIEKPMGTYTARHTHATVLKRKGVSVAAIGENLGHSSSATTESYLDSFTDDVKKEYAEMLTDF
jgi:integrase/recombinase XerD